MNPIVKFISILLSSREQAHIFHLQTPSYAQHKASNTILEDDSTVSYFMGLQKFVDEIRGELPQDGELNNTVDEIAGLLSSTIYKLKFLK